MNRILLLGAMASMVPACGSTPATTLSASWAPPTMLQYVPADTPYFMVSLESAERVDDFVLDEVGSDASDLLATFREPPDGPVVRVGWQLLHEVAGKTRQAWWNDLGLKPDGRYVLYGLGLWPVLRIELADPARTKAALDRVMAGAGRVALFDGKPGWQVEQDKVTLAAAVRSDELVVMVAPTTWIQKFAEHAVADRPARALSSAQVSAIADRHHLGTSWLMVVDSEHLVTTIARLDAASAKGPSPGCEHDFRRLAALTPRYVFGYSKVAPREITARFAIELAPALARGLDKLHVAMPALEPRGDDPLMTMQVAIDPEAAAGWLRAGLSLLLAQPFTCKTLRGLDDGAAALRTRLDQPLPEPIRRFHGFQMVVDDASLTPPSGTGYALFAGTGVAAVLKKLGPIPGLGPLLPGGSKPVALPTQIPNLEAFFGVSVDRAVAAVGRDSSARVSHELAAAARDRPPLMTFSADYRAAARLFPDKSSTELRWLQHFGRTSMVVDTADDSVVVDFELRK